MYTILLTLLSTFATATPDMYASPNPATTFQPARATLFAHFSNAAYCSASSLSDWSCPACKIADPTFVVSKVISGAKAQTQAFVGSSNTTSSTGNIVISFRGSETFENWLHNLDFPKKNAYPKCSGCEVHEGFLSAWTEIQDEGKYLSDAGAM